MTIKGFIRCWPQSLVTESIPGALDHRADLHAVGVVLYGALCGPGPFDGLKEPGEVFLAHRRDAALPSGVAQQPIPQLTVSKGWPRTW